MKPVFLRLRVICITLLFSLMIASSMKSQGFQSGSESARALGSGFASFCGFDDASTLTTNSAGLTQLKDGAHVSLGGIFLAPKARFIGESDQLQNTLVPVLAQTIFLPALFAAYSYPEYHLAIGFGYSSPLIARNEWDTLWVGRGLVTNYQVATSRINGALAYSVIDDQLTIAFGYSLLTAEVVHSSRITTYFPEPTMTIDMSGKGSSWNVAATYKVDDAISLGAVYESGATLPLTGTVSYELDQRLQPGFTRGTAATDFSLPSEIRLGAKYSTANLKYTAGFDLASWSAWDSVRYKLSTKPGAISGDSTLISSRMFGTSLAFRFGAEYAFDDFTTARIGLFHQSSAVDDQFLHPTLPTSSQVGISFGFDIQIDTMFRLTAGYCGRMGATSEAKSNAFNLNGSYSVWSNSASASLLISL